MKIGRLAVGILIATLAAGPIFVLPFIGMGLIRGDTTAPSALAQGLAISAFAIPYGAMLAILPNVLGAAAMVWAGGQLPLARSWIAWASAGLVSGALLGLLIGTGGPLMLGWTGLWCALICRAMARWTD